MEKKPAIKTIEVTNLRTLETKTYMGITPRHAIVCAYAQERNDYNTWTYKQRYDAMVTEGTYTVSLGDWTVLK